jgi:uncharacterized protein (UPF0333 family)
MRGADATRQRCRLGSAPMEFLLLCIISVLFVFTAGAYFAGRGGH